MVDSLAYTGSRSAADMGATTVRDAESSLSTGAASVPANGQGIAALHVHADIDAHRTHATNVLASPHLFRDLIRSVRAMTHASKKELKATPIAYFPLD